MRPVGISHTSLVLLESYKNEQPLISSCFYGITIIIEVITNLFKMMYLALLIFNGTRRTDHMSPLKFLTVVHLYLQTCVSEASN